MFVSVRSPILSSSRHASTKPLRQRVSAPRTRPRRPAGGSPSFSFRSVRIPAHGKGIASANTSGSSESRVVRGVLSRHNAIATPRNITAVLRTPPGTTRTPFPSRRPRANFRPCTQVSLQVSLTAARPVLRLPHLPSALAPLGNAAAVGVPAPERSTHAACRACIVVIVSTALRTKFSSGNRPFVSAFSSVRHACRRGTYFSDPRRDSRGTITSRSAGRAGSSKRRISSWAALTPNCVTSRSRQL